MRYFSETPGCVQQNENPYLYTYQRVCHATDPKDNVVGQFLLKNFLTTAEKHVHSSVNVIRAAHFVCEQSTKLIMSKYASMAALNMRHAAQLDFGRHIMCMAAPLLGCTGPSIEIAQQALDWRIGPMKQSLSGILSRQLGKSYISAMCVGAIGVLCEKPAADKTPTTAVDRHNVSYDRTILLMHADVMKNKGQLAEIRTHMLNFAPQLGRKIVFHIDTATKIAYTVISPGGSVTVQMVCVSLTKEALRGYGPDLIFADESLLLDITKYNELIVPMLIQVPNRRAILVSTPPVKSDPLMLELAFTDTPLSVSYVASTVCDRPECNESVIAAIECCHLCHNTPPWSIFDKLFNVTGTPLQFTREVRGYKRGIESDGFQIDTMADFMASRRAFHPGKDTVVRVIVTTDPDMGPVSDLGVSILFMVARNPNLCSPEEYSLFPYEYVVSMPSAARALSPPPRRCRRRACSPPHAR